MRPVDRLNLEEKRLQMNTWENTRRRGGEVLPVTRGGYVLDFRKVLRTISSGSGAPGTRFIQFISGFFFALFIFFIVPVYRIITKNISEWTCGFGTSKLARAFGARFIPFLSFFFALFNFFYRAYISYHYQKY